MKKTLYQVHDNYGPCYMYSITIIRYTTSHDMDPGMHMCDPKTGPKSLFRNCIKNGRTPEENKYSSNGHGASAAPGLAVVSCKAPGASSACDDGCACSEVVGGFGALHSDFREVPMPWWVPDSIFPERDLWRWILDEVRGSRGGRDVQVSERLRILAPRAELSAHPASCGLWVAHIKHHPSVRPSPQPSLHGAQIISPSTPRLSFSCRMPLPSMSRNLSDVVGMGPIVH